MHIPSSELESSFSNAFVSHIFTCSEVIVVFRSLLSFLMTPLILLNTQLYIYYIIYSVCITWFIFLTALRIPFVSFSSLLIVTALQNLKQYNNLLFYLFYLKFYLKIFKTNSICCIF